jgi:hypothetical protein
MIIASCLKQLEIEPIHSTLFHQARPKDYPAAVLSKNPVSFHKLWQIDPIDEYTKWFKRKDEEYFEINKHLISDYKYLNRQCVSPAGKAHATQQDINRVEL